MYENTILKKLNDDGFVVSTVKGKSMWPLLNEKNTRVYIEKGSMYKKNDCILFKRVDKTLVLHRIIKIKSEYFLVSGDNQYKLEKVYPNQILGKLTTYFKKGKTKKLKGIAYKLYILLIYLTRPVRFFRDKTKVAIKKITKIKK